MKEKIKLPIIGFGVHKLEGETAYEATRYALDAGYRLIDTAAIYNNEREVGRAIKDSKVRREKICLITKIMPRKFERVEQAFFQSLKLLDTDYVDIYLAHWPGIDEKKLHRAWDVFLKLRDLGYIRGIGASNFSCQHLNDIISYTGETPVCNQIELHPWFQQRETQSTCKKNKIPMIAWAPVFRGAFREEPLFHELSEKYVRPPIQIVLRWHIQHGDIPIPKSSSPEHIRENINVSGFTLSEEDMAKIDALDCGRHIGKDPFTYNGA